MTVRTYSSPQAFKEALEKRLRSASKNGVDFARRVPIGRQAIRPCIRC